MLSETIFRDTLSGAGTDVTLDVYTYEATVMVEKKIIVTVRALSPEHSEQIMADFRTDCFPERLMCRIEHTGVEYLTEVRCLSVTS